MLPERLSLLSFAALMLVLMAILTIQGCSQNPPDSTPKPISTFDDPAKVFAEHVNGLKLQGIIGDANFTADQGDESSPETGAVNSLILFDINSNAVVFNANGIRVRDQQQAKDFILTSKHVLFNEDNGALRVDHMMGFGYHHSRYDFQYFRLDGIKALNESELYGDVIAISIAYSPHLPAFPIENITSYTHDILVEEKFSTTVVAFPYGSEIGRLRQSFSQITPSPLSSVKRFKGMLATDLDSFKSMSGSPVFIIDRNNKTHLIGLISRSHKHGSCMIFQEVICATSIAPVDFKTVTIVTRGGTPLESFQ